MKDSTSPDGTYQIQFEMAEIRMSHWIYKPFIYRTHDHVLLFDLQDDVWSADEIKWLTDSIVQIEARRYPGTLSCQMTLDLERGTGKATRSTAQTSVHFDGTLSEIRNWVLSRKPVMN
ncbi:hypothetical protein [Spirosoma sp.]|uniref:hypothetical protein n=1 Tax=Spirosoma sp. TaxID=1899569 RepID=UPI003B3BE67D